MYPVIVCVCHEQSSLYSVMNGYLVCYIMLYSMNVRELMSQCSISTQNMDQSSKLDATSEEAAEKDSKVLVTESQ